MIAGAAKECKLEPVEREAPATGLRMRELWGRVTVRKIARRLADAFEDLRCTGSLEFMLELLAANWHSGHDVLRDIFRRVDVGDDDVIADIGCGKGRVVAFLSHAFPRSRVIGIEMDDTALFAKKAFARNPRVEIRHATLEEAFPDEATVFFLFPPTDGDLPHILKALVDSRAKRDIRVVAKGAMGDLAEFEADDSWTIERVPPPSGLLRRFFSTHFIYQHDKRGPGYHYGLILQKTVRSAPAPA